MSQHSLTKRRIYKNLENQKFGNLTVIKMALSERDRQGWECLCDCGNVVVLETSRLLRGECRTCGKCQHKCHGDLTGKQIKNWTVLRQSNKRPIKYICKCVCGKEKELTKYVLVRPQLIGHCGCIDKAKRTEEQEQRNLLRRNRNKFILRDDYTCQLCGKKKESYKLKNHHIFPFKSHIHLRLDSNNILILCSKCHLLVHGEHSFNNIDMRYQKILLEIMNWKITEPKYQPIKIE